MAKKEDNAMLSKYKLYLYDLGPLLKDEASRLNSERDEAKDPEMRSVLSAQLVTLSFIIGLLQQQADAFGIPRKELRLDDIDPDSLL